MQLKDDDPLRNEINEIVDAAGRAKDLVRQILSFTRRTEQELVPVKVQLIAKEAMKFLRASIPATIEFRTEIDSDCRAVLADPTKIHQIIMNLCTNAYHAMHEKGGVLSLLLRETEIGPEDSKTHFQLTPGNYLKLEVSDTGSGMTREVQDKIFEPYFTTKEKGKGTGLGLSLVQAIVQNLKGHIAVYSEPSSGTTFRVYLPVIETNGRAAGTSPVSGKTVGGNEHLLVVDDEEAIVGVERQMLEQLGYHVTATTDSREALRLFKENPDAFDLIISDMTMPEMTGTELIENIRSVRPGLPAILCTGYSEIMNAEKARGIGIEEFLTKPVTVNDFSAAVRNALDRKKTE